MLISPEQTYFIRENLRLRLLDARIALLQHNGEVYQSDLNNVEATVKQYFDSKSPCYAVMVERVGRTQSP